MAISNRRRPFVGRERELRALRERLDAARTVPAVGVAQMPVGDAAVPGSCAGMLFGGTG